MRNGKAFEELKAKLVSQLILFAPDFATDFILQTDASEVGAGVVLSQRIEGEEHPIVFLSKKFSKAERNYSTVERELAAIIFGLKRLKHYLDGQKFIIETDHNPLRTILDRVLGARAAGVHYRLFSFWTLVPVRLDQQLSDHSTVDEIASGAVDCRLTYTMANCPQRRLEKPGERRKKKERTRKRRKKSSEKTRAGRFRKRRGESQSFLLGDADQESEARMSKNALRTGRRQAVE
ncbi:retrovirus-related Pol polyprotein from transposon 297 [Trichonephila clavipes]|nr:retrovirus-related Pol polyprotein from transposon 297 [Trichonephila clavipes]